MPPDEAAASKAVEPAPSAASDEGEMSDDEQSAASSSSASTISIVNALGSEDEDEMAVGRTILKKLSAEVDAKMPEEASPATQTSNGSANSSKITFKTPRANNSSNLCVLNRAQSNNVCAGQPPPAQLGPKPAGQYRHHSFQSRHLLGRSRNQQLYLQQQQQQPASSKEPQLPGASPRLSSSPVPGSAGQPAHHLQATRSASSSFCHHYGHHRQYRHQYTFDSALASAAAPSSISPAGSASTASGAQQQQASSQSPSLSARRLTGPQSLRLKLIATSWLASSFLI